MLCGKFDISPGFSYQFDDVIFIFTLEEEKSGEVGEKFHIGAVVGLHDERFVDVKEK